MQRLPAWLGAWVAALNAHPPDSSNCCGLCPYSLRQLAVLLACLARVSASYRTKRGITAMPSFPDAHKHRAKDQLKWKGELS